ncbi:MAG: CerR family C-terminal domain-containing protein [Magnetococcales bacterium]|nr:CerR family C-terminal domain-containing protein [Magnetococcales bacterium]
MKKDKTDSVDNISKSSKNSVQAKTRERLLQAALTAFGHHDFDSVSTRQIADAAGANISAISYHFGGKGALYMAVAAYIVENIHPLQAKNIDKVNLALHEMEQVGVDVERCRLLLQNLLRQHALNILTSELGEDVPGFILREQSHPTKAFAILYNNLFEPLHTVVTKLVASIKGLSPGHKEACLVAHALLGQIIYFRVGRTGLLRRLEQQSYSSKDIEQISLLVSTLANQALNYTILEEDSP